MDTLKNILKFFKREEENITFSSRNELEGYEVYTDIEDNKSLIKNIFSKSEDVVYREIYLNEKKLLLVYINSLIDRTLIEDQILKPIVESSHIKGNIESVDLNTIRDKLLTVSELNSEISFEKLIDALLSGETLLFCDCAAQALVINSVGGEKRGIDEPFTEQGVRTPKDSFNESIQDNITLLRRRIKDQNLVVQFYNLGQRTKTKTALIYLVDKAPEHVLKEVRKRINKVNVESIVVSGSLEQCLENHKWSVFPQMLYTEIPDRVVRCILDGRVAIIVDGSPYNLVVPGTFAMFFNSGDDYYERTVIASILRISRYISFILATTLPALYVALTDYHPGMLPTSLVLYITGTRVGLPFPSVIEMFFMLFTIEIILEAAIRLPKPIAQTVGIVGGLVIGQSAVQAGLVSPLVVIIIAFTAISSFVLPYYNFAMVSRSLRIFLLLGASFWGLVGVVVFWLLILIHMASIETFGIRYFQDFFSFKKEKLKDTLVKVPHEYLSGQQEALKEDTKK